MKSNLTKQKSVHVKQNSNELALRTPTHQNITLYNAENSEFLSEKCISLQGLLLNIAEVDYLIETATLCLPAIQDLLNTSRALIEDISRSVDPDLWPTYAGMFGELATQIESVIAESSYKNRNLLRGDTITLKFNEDESYNFTITGKNLGATVDVLNSLVSPRPVTQKQLREIKAKLEDNNGAIKALNVILDSTAAVIRSKKMFTQKLLHRFTNRLNAMRSENEEMARLAQRQTPSLTSRLEENNRLQAPQTQIPEIPELPESAFGGDTPAAGNDVREPVVNDLDNQKAFLADLAQAQPDAEKEAESKDRAERKETRSEGGLISLFPLFRSGKKSKNNEPQGIRTILNRLKNTEADLVDETPTAQENMQEKVEQEAPSESAGVTVAAADGADTSDGQSERQDYLDQVCLEMLVQLKSDAVASLQALAASGNGSVYADHLSRIIAKEKLHLELLVRESADMKRILEKFEQAFHLLVKEKYQQAPEKTESYIRDWLNSNYGAIYKVVFSVLRSAPKE